ncbi:MAG: tetratricopeptide repeat protein [Deltaproteobacteria bacterium]|nr:tetratricopeptide repeat protein [Deltaproteobacteria bacterium]
MRTLTFLLAAAFTACAASAACAQTPPPKNAAAESLEEFTAAMAAVAKGDRKAAAPRFEKAIFLMPQWSLPRLEYAINCIELNCDPKTAIEHLKTAATLDSENPRTQHYTGVALERQEDPAGAEAAYARSVTLKPSYKDPHFALGRLLRKSGKHLEARAHLQAVVDLDPKNTSARLMLAELCEALGVLDDAEEQIQAVIDLHPENTYHQHRLAQFFERTGQKDKAKAAFKATEKAAPAKPQKKLRPLQPSKK